MARTASDRFVIPSSAARFSNAARSTSSSRTVTTAPAPTRLAAPGSRTGQLLKVVASLSFVSPGLDLLAAYATSVEKMLTHGNIVYETRSQSLPLNLNTRQPDSTTEPDNDPPL